MVSGMIGRVLGHYRITAAIGAGGMGEVYAAEDLRLHRRVALKVLPALMALNHERRERFTQEARAIAALSHPNIVTVHSIEDIEGVHFLTMELVDGQPLSARIPRHGMAMDALLAVAIPLAEAVDAAHARGITHRDLKPTNVMVTHDGRVKVLDFGLAKLRDPSTAADDATTMGLTAEGRIVGTAAYMSPEQADSKPVDHRSDLFSLGVMLYEMASGERPFKGDSAMSVLSAVMRDDPQPLSGVNPALPRDLIKIVKKCLAKDPERRYQSAKDLRNDLEELRGDLVSGELTMPMRSGSGTGRFAAPRRYSTKAFAAVLAIAVTAVAWASWTSTRTPPAETGAMWHFAQLTSLSGVEEQPTLSPDGRWIAYAHPAGDAEDIFLAGVGGTNAINLTGASGADSINNWPAFSPDGERLTFWSSRNGGGIHVMGRTGESPRRLTDFGDQPSWFPDGRRIVFCTNAVDTPLVRSGTGQLWTVGAEGGKPAQIEGPFDVMTPRVSPNGRRIAYWGFPSESDPNREIWTIPVAGGTPVRVASDPAVDWNPVWAPDGRSLYFLSDRGGTMQIWQIDVDESSGRTTGEPRALTTPSRFVAHLTVSGDGRRVAYSSMDLTSNLTRYAFDAAAGVIRGAATPLTTGSRAWTNPSPSPDGQRIAFTSSIGQEDVFVARADGTGITQLTNDAARDRTPKWSVDGETLAFHSDRGGAFSIWMIQADGRGLARVMDPKGDGYIIPVWSPDGRRLAASQGNSVHRLAIVTRTPSGWSAPELVAAAPAGFAATSWSKDGNWLIGMNLGRNWELAGLHLGSGEYRVFASEPGGWPVWLPDSRRFVYIASGRLKLGDLSTPSAPGRSLGDFAAVTAFELAAGGGTLVTATSRDEADLWLMEARGGR